MNREETKERAWRDRLLEGLPVKERQLDIAGVNTMLLEGGDGPPLVLLHGGIQSGGVVWWRSISRLADSHRVIVPDFPGLGASESFAQFDMAATLDWLEDLIDKTTDKPPTLVAHSLLGVFAARFAMEKSHLLRRLVLVDSPGLGQFRPKPRLVMALLMSMLRPGDATLNRFMSQVLHDIDTLRKQEKDGWDAFMSYLGSLAARPAVRKTMRRLPKGNLGPISEAALRRIEVPVSLIWGSHDPNTRLGTAERASELYGWPLRLVGDAGHIPHLEQPEMFFEALRSVMESG